MVSANNELCEFADAASGWLSTNEFRYSDESSELSDYHWQRRSRATGRWVYAEDIEAEASAHEWLIANRKQVTKADVQETIAAAAYICLRSDARGRLRPMQLVAG